MATRGLIPFWSSRPFAMDLFEELDRFFNQDFPTFRSDKMAFLPPVEVEETDDKFLLEIDLPGMDPQDIKIETEGNRLMISGERKKEVKEGAKEKMQRFERSYGYFRREFTLPSTVDVDNLTADYRNGVLELNLPKKESTKPRTIPIGTNADQGRQIQGRKSEKDVEAGRQAAG